MDEKETYTLTDGMSLLLTAEDTDGYACRLERWKSPVDGGWWTGVAICDATGRKMLHAGYTSVPMTREAALEQIAMARTLDASLEEYERRRGEMHGA